ncbi:MAG TPA: hypothetical protein VMB34_18230 [Acetobacteraceae bacterium]|nr:hypothetical protein [Acetobacteraceae bacterium]
MATARSQAPPLRGQEPATPHQFDLFSGAGASLGGEDTPPAAPTGRSAPARENQSVAAADKATLTDAALIAAIPDATRTSCHPLAAEAARRKLAAAIPALEALCRRFKGFGLHHAVPEQVAALRAMAAIRGPDAVAALRRIITEAIVAGPGLSEAVRAAAALRCILAEPTAVALLRHPDPATRADACRCTPRGGDAAIVLASLLEDLHPDVATEAAKALAHMGRSDGRLWLLRRLHQRPDAALLSAIAAIADDEVTVLLGRVARTDPDLRQAALDALEAIETPRAAAVLASLAAAGLAPGAMDHPAPITHA